MIRKKVGARLRELRAKKGFSQEKFALNIGLDRTYIASVESGKRNISIINLEKIWAGLGLNAKEFFDDDVFKGGATMIKPGRGEKDKNHALVLEAKERVLRVIDSIPPEELVFAIKDAPSLRGMILGYVAEYQFLNYLKGLNKFTEIEQPDDHDRTKNKADILFSYCNVSISFQLKSVQTNSIGYLKSHQILLADVQNDASDRRKIKLPNGHEVETTNYKVGDYDILAVPLFPFTGQWDFAYMLNEECQRTDSKKYNEEDRPFLLKTTERISYPLTAPWTSSLDEIIERALRCKKAKSL